jgi:flagellar biosynthesis chaperone FliJ
MPGSNSVKMYEELLGKYAMQYAGVPKFKSTVTTLRDLHIERDLEITDKFIDELELYREAAQKLHELKDHTQDPEYAHAHQAEQVRASDVHKLFNGFIKALESLIQKFKKVFKAWQSKMKYLESNRRAASDMINWMKANDKVCEAHLKTYSHGIDMVLETIRQNAGIVQPRRK